MKANQLFAMLSTVPVAIAFCSCSTIRKTKTERRENTTASRSITSDSTGSKKVDSSHVIKSSAVSEKDTGNSFTREIVIDLDSLYRSGFDDNNSGSVATNPEADYLPDTTTEKSNNKITVGGLLLDLGRFKPTKITFREKTTSWRSRRDSFNFFDSAHLVKTDTGSKHLKDTSHLQQKVVDVAKIKKSDPVGAWVLLLVLFVAGCVLIPYIIRRKQNSNNMKTFSFFLCAVLCMVLQSCGKFSDGTSVWQDALWVIPWVTGGAAIFFLVLSLVASKSNSTQQGGPRGTTDNTGNVPFYKLGKFYYAVALTIATIGIIIAVNWAK